MAWMVLFAPSYSAVFLLSLSLLISFQVRQQE